MIKVQSGELVNNGMSQALADRTAALKSKADQPVKSDKEIDKAAGGFEALLLQQMLKAMWETVETTGLTGENSNASQIYRDMFHQAIADKIAEGRGMGVKDFVKKELSKQGEHPTGETKSLKIWDE